jgi:NitT/TauT family transport system ATP-binding protein
VTAEALIELTGVRAFAGAAPVTLRVGRGERVALLGRNGIGKSTLLRAIAGLAAPAAGSLRRPPSVGYVPQDYRGSLLPWLSVIDNVGLPLRALRLTPGERDARIDDAVSAVSLPAALLGRTPQQLSGGEQQLVALARALTWRAPAVLFDEALSALDVSTRASLRRRLAGFMEARGLACVMVSHDLDDVLALATRWVVLGGAAGEVVRDEPASVGRDPLERAVLGAEAP